MSEQEFTMKCLTDEKFREEFKKDPVGVMRAHNVHMADGIEVEVLEATPTKQYFVLPPIQTGELDDSALKSVTGGDLGSGTTILGNTTGPECD